MKRRSLPYWSYPHTWRGFRITNANPILANVPCVYLIEHFTTGKCYIGATHNLARRLMEHAYDHRSKKYVPRLSAALSRFGRQDFGVTPLYCSFDHDTLHDVEAAMISAYNSVHRGYNVAKSEQDRRALFGTRTAASWADPISRAKRIRIGSSAASRERKSKAMLGRQRITNGRVEKMISITAAIPPGWRRGGVSRKGRVLT